MKAVANLSAVLAAVWLACLACVSTEIEPLPLPVCAAGGDPSVLTSSVVSITHDGPVSEICNAVFIAPTLLLTAVNCVANLASPENPRAGFSPPHCINDTGAVIEDGSFLDRFSTLAEPESIVIEQDDGAPIDARVARVFLAGVESTCMPSIAVLQLQFPLGVPRAPVPVQLDEVDLLGRELLVIGFDVSEDDYARHVSPATVIEATFDVGSDTLPPRSLRLSGQACTLAGGAVIAADTGALVGSIRTSALTIACPVPMASPLAVRVAPFRRFLLETARDVTTSLVAEPSSEGSLDIPSCPQGG
jgi:hypothetical protein